MDQRYINAIFNNIAKNVRPLLRERISEMPIHAFTMTWDHFWQKFNEFLEMGRHEILLHHILYNYNPEWNYKA